MFELQIAIVSIALLRRRSVKRVKRELASSVGKIRLRPGYFQSEKSDLGMSHKMAIKQEKKKSFYAELSSRMKGGRYTCVTGIKVVTLFYRLECT